MENENQDESYLLEIGRDRDADIARLQDDDERKRRRVEAPEEVADRRPMEGRETPKTTELPIAAEKMPEADRSLPKEIEDRYYVEKDRKGDAHIYADSKGQREIFQDAGDFLRTKSNDAHGIKLMLDTAAYRGWTQVTVKGTPEFRREAWLEGQARGIVVNGHKPTELDRQELLRREQVYLKNEIVRDDERDLERSGSAGDQEPAARNPERAGIIDGGNRASTPEAERSDQRPATLKEGVTGVLKETGTRPYQDNDKNDPSPYAVLETDRGERTLWGVGIPDALHRAGARLGDEISLREAGMETVVKNVIREIDSKKVRIPQEVERRAWEADVVRERTSGREDPDRARAFLDPDREGERADRAFRDASRDRLERGTSRHEPDEREAEREVNRTVGAGNKTLHSGPARDDALENGSYANEVRAKEFATNGRAAAGKTPELRPAAAMEAYVERQLRKQLDGDPAALSRAMTKARQKITNEIAKGHDFPMPRVRERELHRTETDKAQSIGKTSENAQEKQTHHFRTLEQGREGPRGR